MLFIWDSKFKSLKTLETLQSHPDPDSPRANCEIQTSDFLCKKCHMAFKVKKNLQAHIKSVHPAEIQCEKCDMNFTSNCDYEKHLEEEHKSNKKFSCKDCGKGFVIRWRLKKHENIHTSTMKKNCHFFNNNKRCPYEDLGCMFLDQKSPMCTFDRLCSNLEVVLFWTFSVSIRLYCRWYKWKWVWNSCRKLWIWLSRNDGWPGKWTFCI